jgi:hypothetical protein
MKTMRPNRKPTLLKLMRELSPLPSKRLTDTPMAPSPTWRIRTTLRR